MTSSRRVVLGLVLGIAAGLFFGELVAPLKIVADGFVRLLQMTVLPYVTLSIIANLGSLSYAQARKLGLRAGAVMATIWLAAVCFACLFPLAFPDIQSASFFSPELITPAEPFSFLDLYVPSNPFESLAKSVVPAVVLFSVLLGLALIGVDNKQPLLDVLHSGSAAVGRMARFIIRLTPIGIFAIAAHASGTLDVDQMQRLQVYMVTYMAFALLFSLWVLPGLISALTPIGAAESLATSRDALLTAFLVGDLFIVLPALMESCSKLIETHLDSSGATGELPHSIIPISFTFPHAGKLLSISFVLFAAWFSDVTVPVYRYPELALTGFFAFFGSLNIAVPFLLDLFRIPADAFQLLLATGVINGRFGTLVAAVHTIAVGLLGSAAIAGKLRFQPGRLLRFFGITAVLTATVIGGLRVGFASLFDLELHGLELVYSMRGVAYAPYDNALVRSPSDIPADAIPPPDRMLESIRSRGTLRVGLIDDGIPYAFRNDEDELVGFDVEMARRLADDLGVEIEFVRFAQAELDARVKARIVDIVMTGARVTPERAGVFFTSQPYVEETLAIVTPDHRRQQFQSWDRIQSLGAVRIGVQNLPYYLDVTRNLLPAARLEVIENTALLIDQDADYDAYVLPAERGSVLTIANPQFSVVIPEGATVKMPLAYPIAGEDLSWVRYVNTWIGLKKGDGFIERLYDHWILGRDAVPQRRRWSVIRNLLHWVD